MSTALEQRIAECEARLRAGHPGVTRCRMMVEDRPPREFERKRFNARLELTFAGRELVVNREHDEDPNRAIDDALAAASGQLALLEGALRRR